MVTRDEDPCSTEGSLTPSPRDPLLVFAVPRSVTLSLPFKEGSPHLAPHQPLVRQSWRWESGRGGSGE